MLFLGSPQNWVNLLQVAAISISIILFRIPFGRQKPIIFFLQVKNEWAGWSERHGVTVRHRVGIINQKKIIIRRRRGIPLKKEEVSEMWKASPFHCCLLATQGFFLQPEISICQRRLLFQLK
jgi:hypothetical protein